MGREALFVAVGVCLAALGGCTGLAPEAAGDRPPAAEVDVRSVDGREFAAVLEGYRGRVVLIDYWATWCPPCVALFPHTVELQRRFAEQGLAVVSVSFDDEESLPAVRRFLRAKGAAFPHFISRHGASPRSADEFGLASGALPVLKLLDRSGKLQATFGDGADVDVAAVDRAVEELLGR